MPSSGDKARALRLGTFPGYFALGEMNLPGRYAHYSFSGGRYEKEDHGGVGSRPRGLLTVWGADYPTKPITVLRGIRPWRRQRRPGPGDAALSGEDPRQKLREPVHPRRDGRDRLDAARQDLVQGRLYHQHHQHADARVHQLHHERGLRVATSRTWNPSPT
ncbi:MAG: hypothetical protein MZV63_03535 [Marinilabiliales bacterium]|nr:hypothetical protein [Marinilabiliales bacterium]